MEKFTEVMKAIWVVVKNACVIAWNTVCTFLKAAWVVIKPAVKTAWKAIVAFAKKCWQWACAFVAKLLGLNEVEDGKAVKICLISFLLNIILLIIALC